MPDLLSHLLVGLILCEFLKVKRKSLLLIGSLLPDLLGKLYVIGFVTKIPYNLSDITYYFHTPLMCTLAILLIIPLFKGKNVFFSFFIGAMMHFGFDIFQQHFIGGTLLGVPFFYRLYRFNLIWPGEYYYFLIPLFIIYIIIKTASLKCPHKTT